LYSSSQTQRRQNTQEKKKKNQEKGGSLPLSSRFAFSLLVPTFTLLFQTLSPHIFFFLNIKK
jgi:hypothetical protein